MEVRKRGREREKWRRSFRVGINAEKEIFPFFKAKYHFDKDVNCIGETIKLLSFNAGLAAQLCME